MLLEWEKDTFNYLSQSRILGRIGLKDIQVCPECFLKGVCQFTSGQGMLVNMFLSVVVTSSCSGRSVSLRNMGQSWREMRIIITMMMNNNNSRVDNIEQHYVLSTLLIHCVSINSLDLHKNPIRQVQRSLPFHKGGN